jgi:hypothetical protein
MKTHIYKFNTRNFLIEIAAIEENFPDLSFDDTGEIAEKIESGELEIFTARARAYCNGLLVGEEYLGNCIYKDPADFRDNVGMRSRGHGSYFSGMIKEVCSQARDTIKKMPTLRK